MIHSKNQLALSILTILIIATLIPVASAAPIKVISVPWQGDINKYHATWSEQEIILKGVIHTDTTDPIWYKWNLGDGTPESVVNTLSGKTQYNVEIKHTYTGAEETPFIAKLIVADNDALVNPIEDPYLVKIQAANLDSKINVAIDNGLWFLYKSGSDGSGYYHTFDNSPFMVWSYSSYYASPTASAVHAFEINGHKETGNPDEDPYVESVKKGLNWLFNGYYYNTNYPMLQSTNIGVTPNGDDPDTNGNGKGIGVRDYGNNPVYESGMVMDAIIASGTPDADSGRDFDGDGVTDTYQEVLQDMADMYAWGQNDGGNHKGGWRYRWNYGSSDNSISQWAAIGMIPAQESPWNVVVPQWVKDYNNNPWTTYSYNQWTSGGVTYGGFGYSSNSPIWGYNAVTPSGMIQLAFSGQTTSDSRWEASERWLADNWNSWRDTGGRDVGSANIYAYYAFAKAMRLAKPDPVVTFSSNNFDWYRGDGITMGLAEKVANQLVANSYWNYYGTNLGTSWSIIILRPVLFQEAPIGRFDADPNPSYPDKPINFDPSGSDHSQAEKDINNLVLFEWDWDNDGVYDESTTTPEKVTHPFSCPSIPCTYPVKLKVIDDNDPARISTYVMNIQITYPPHPPVANAGGPYFVSLSPGDVLILDGSESYDPNEGLHEAACLTCPDDTITAWEWDLNGAPWDYNDKSGEIVDLSSDITTYFLVPGSYNIGLRARDGTATSYPASGDPDLTDEDFAVVNVFEDVVGEVNAMAFCNAVSLSWADVGADHYDIYRSFLGENSGYQFIGSTTENTKFAGSFVMDKDHWYRIMAVTGEIEALSQTVKVKGEPSLCNPTADPGGPYEGNVGEAIKLDGSGSIPQTGVIVTWEWDLDNDGLYDDAFGESFHHVWDSPGVYDIGLQVTSSDSLVLTHEAFTIVDIKNSIGKGAPTPEIEQLFIDAYNRNGGLSVLGSPTTQIYNEWGYWMQNFPGAFGYAGGRIMYNPYKKNAYYIHGAIWERYYNLGGPKAATDENFDLGPPTSDIEPYVHTQSPEVSSHGTEFRDQKFEGGSLVQNLTSGKVYEVHGAIYDKLKHLGAASSALGIPTTDEKEVVVLTPIFTGRYNEFEGGIVFWNREMDDVWIIGLNQPGAKKIADKYHLEGGSGDWLGFLVSNDYINPSGFIQCNFEGGYITTNDGVNYEAFEYADKEPPTLLITTPEYGEDAESYRIKVSGSASDESGMYTILVNGNPIAYYNTNILNTDSEFVKPFSKFWNTNVELKAGENTIVVTAIDLYYNSVKKVITVNYNSDFSFAHITDVHIADGIGDTGHIRDKWKIVGYSKSASNFIGTLREVNDKKPSFILSTGDLVEYDNKKLFERYMNLLDAYISKDINIYHTAGNHDQRKNLKETNLDNYNAIIENRGQFTEFEDGHDDYYFETAGYLFIGLESGKDITQLFEYPFTPEGSGLQNNQMDKLNELLDRYPNIPKIIFMHHPAINNDDDKLIYDKGNVIYGVSNTCTEHGGNDESIARNRCEFIDNSIKYNVQLVLTGHTHEAHIFDANGKEFVKADSVDSHPLPYFIQTPSATKDKGLWPSKYNHGYRIIDIKNDKVDPHTYTPTSAHPKITGLLKCPAHLHTYDSQGGHTGLSASGDAEIDISGSFYIGRYNYSDQNEPEIVLLYNTTEEYRFEIVANLTEEEKNSPEIESFNFTVEQEREDMRTTISYINVPLTENTIATLAINLTTTTYAMEIDYDGDGVTDETRYPDFIGINYAPTAAIISPKTGSIYGESEHIELNGTGRDSEDGILTNFSLIWYSDMDGAIGAGERLSTTNLSTGMHKITLMVNDSVDLVDTASVMITIVDTTPPSSISNLNNTAGTTWITWNWTNPTDSDFDHTEIYLNGVLQTQTTGESFSASGLNPGADYTLLTCTVDTSGNMGTWFGLSSTTSKPVNALGSCRSCKTS